METEYETNFVIGKILEACEFNPNSNPIEHLVGVAEGEWAVLARNNNNLSEIAMAMVAYGIPHIYKGKSLWDESPVCLAIGLLSSLVSGSKAGFDAALYFSGMDDKILTRLHKDFGDDFAQMFYGRSNFDIYEKGTADNLKKFSDKVPQWGKALAKGRVGNVVRGAFDWFIDHLDNSKDDKKSKSTYHTDLKRLSSAKTIMANMTGDLASRIRRVMSKPETTNKRAVFLGTLHSSKGLEFKNVWLVQMDKDVMPSSKEDLTQEIQDEERRLFYVGMTRAKDALYISCTNEPSIYIEETGIKLVSLFDEDVPKIDIKKFQHKQTVQPDQSSHAAIQE
jgi:superfamily I DNA/RNA helicase